MAKDHKHNSKSQPKFKSVKRAKQEEMDEQEFKKALEEALRQPCQPDFDEQDEVA